MSNKVNRFEDLLCWQKARELVNFAFELSETGKLAVDYGTQRQFKTAALGTMNNIAEGFGRYSSRDFVKFLDYAASSGMEVRSMSYVLLDRKYVSQNDFDKLHKLTVDHANLTLGLIRRLLVVNKTPEPLHT